MLVDEERQEYEIRANYDDVVPMEESFSITAEEKVFVSKDLRARAHLCFQRHKKILKTEDCSEPNTPFKDFIQSQ